MIVARLFIPIGYPALADQPTKKLVVVLSPSLHIIQWDNNLTVGFVVVAAVVIVLCVRSVTVRVSSQMVDNNGNIMIVGRFKRKKMCFIGRFIFSMIKKNPNPNERE